MADIAVFLTAPQNLFNLFAVKKEKKKSCVAMFNYWSHLHWLCAPSLMHTGGHNSWMRIKVGTFFLLQVELHALANWFTLNFIELLPLLGYQPFFKTTYIQRWITTLCFFNYDSLEPTPDVNCLFSRLLWILSHNNLVWTFHYNTACFCLQAGLYFLHHRLSLCLHTGVICWETLTQLPCPTCIGLQG